MSTTLLGGGWVVGWLCLASSGWRVVQWPKEGAAC